MSPPEGDALTALERFAAIARDRTKTRDERALAVRFIIHIVGDLHQPLHVGNGTDRSWVVRTSEKLAKIVQMLEADT